MVFNFSGMILAAGFGKRMMPLTKNIPKSLIEINGVTLLNNSINFLKKLGCDQIIINTHYQYLKIEKSIKQRELKDNIILIHEKNILDTGGAVKNAIPHFINNHLLIINSDIFWQDENLQDARSLIDFYSKNYYPHILIVEKKNVFGLSKKNGDFILKENRILRYTKGNKFFFYSGLQILDKKIFNEFANDNFSFNVVWDFFINQQVLCGQIMQSNLYHVGDIQGLNLAKKLCS